jgi:hypothetical protein
MIKLKRVGWAGFCDDKPQFDVVTDTYSETPALAVYRAKEEARRRFEDVREVFVEAKLERDRSG